MQTTTGDANAPRVIGRYRVLGELGAGGMGTVYRVFDPELNREVALKVPHFAGPAGLRDRQAARFRREALAAARVMHPHVCPVFDVGEHAGVPFVVLALVEGESLADHLARSGLWPDVGAAVALVLQLLDALASVHAAGLVHRDVKPGNVLLDAAGRALLTDFGLARPLVGAEALTSAGAVLGTPAYMAPEQAASDLDAVGPRADLYGASAVLFHLLTGRPPFQGSALEVVVQLGRDDPPPPDALRPGLPAGLSDIVLRALHKDPVKRYPDAHAFAVALAPFAPPGVAVMAPPSAPTIELRAPARPRAASGFMWRAAGWLLGAAVIAAGALMGAAPWYQILSGAMFAEEQPIGSERGELIPIVMCTLAALLLALVGTLLWQTTESFYTRAGLLYWSRVGWPGPLRCALAAGVPPDGRDDLGATALMRAASGGHAEAAATLLLHGADPAQRDTFGRTALDVAEAAGRTEVVALLRRAGRHPDGAPIRLDRRWRPRPLVALLLSAALGGLIAGLIFSQLKSHPVSADELLALGEAGSLKRVEHIRGYVFAELKASAKRGTVRSFLRGRSIYVGPPEDSRRLLAELRRRNPRQFIAADHVVIGWNVESQVWPGDWVLLPLMLVPMALFGFTLGPLLRWRAIYPMLAPCPDAAPTAASTTELG